jgi:hypothetical protein
MSRSVPLTPRLFAPTFAREHALVHRLLFENAPDDVPVFGLTEDGEPLTEERLETLGLDFDDAFDDAVTELGDASDGGWEEQIIPVKGGGELRILVRQGEGASAEELLVSSVIEEAAEALEAKAIAIAVPTRGTLLATDADQKWQLVAAFATAAKMQHAQGGEDALWPGILRGEDGAIVGTIQLSTVSLDAAARREKGSN